MLDESFRLLIKIYIYIYQFIPKKLNVSHAFLAESLGEFI